MVKTNERGCDDTLGVCGMEEGDKPTNDHFKLEIYVFTDPLCPACWGMEPKLKKIQLEYGHLFKMRFFIVPEAASWCVNEQNQKSLVDLWETTATRTGMCCDGDIWHENPLSHSEAPAIAVKAAEMQGRQYGILYLRRLREALFLKKENISNEEILLSCAKRTQLDLEEFRKDLNSDLARKALESDVNTTHEMDAEAVPTMIFFNDRIEDAGLKVSGLHSYDVYEDILAKMLGDYPQARKKMDIDEFVRTYQFVATQEVAEVYDLSMKEANARLKALQLQQKVESIPVKRGTFWQPIPPEK
ncbi:putative DsbA family dithiol-disulfide isomerase [Geomicrobium halophilum]|uniref:ClpXP adapter protein SpxH n=1 Tax=Geomicrobium halophilum TaxID=549000 RepID=A0A841PQ94_9BACL|nr:ClpXP adapter SpxH family protein [Geomicrobium halophilum]MBB6448481.1 putative DsbA family dithiol-disulfide isomerase [Geomicrobium halophilum]